jgi:dethiobiotin synthase
MLRGLFVTGTDTGIGKTVVSAALMHRHREAVSAIPGRRLRYWKPIQTGTATDDDTRDVERMGSCRKEELLADGVRFPEPLSPHLAARLNGAVIRLADVTAIAAGQPSGDRWIVEGAGGLLVPLNDTELIADLIGMLHMPVVLVSRAALGTINHSLLTLEALRRREIAVAGVVMVGDRNAENRRAVESYGRVPVLGELPMFDPLTPPALARWSAAELDPEGRLQEYFE